MKQLSLVIVLLCLVGCSATPSTTKATKPSSGSTSKPYLQPVGVYLPKRAEINKAGIDELIASTQRIIKNGKFEQPLKKWSDQALIDLEKIRATLKDPGVDVQALQLDCVMMIHDTVATMDDPNPEAATSQNRAKEILDFTRPDLIGMEGADVDVITFDSLADRMVEMSVVPMTKPQALAEVKSRVPQDAVLMYILEKPEVPVTGTELASLSILQMAVGNTVEQLGGMLNEEVEANLTDLNNKLTLIRSYIAVVKTIQSAQRHNVKHCSIVIGGSHGPEILQYGSMLGLHMRFYQAVPEEVQKAHPDLQW